MYIKQAAAYGVCYFLSVRKSIVGYFLYYHRPFRGSQSFCEGRRAKRNSALIAVICRLLQIFGIEVFTVDDDYVFYSARYEQLAVGI